MPTLELKATHKVVPAYYANLAKFEKLGIKHETALRSAFHERLESFARQFNWKLFPEYAHRKGQADAKADAVFAQPLLRLALSFALLGACATATAQKGQVLNWIPNSSVKVEQIIGDQDWADAARGTNTPTTSLTVSRFHVLGNGLGYSFEHDGKLIFLFGDTISENITTNNYHGADPLAWSMTTDGEAGLLINFYTNSDGLPLFIKPPGLKLAGDELANSGFSLNHQIYLICHSGSDPSDPDNPHLGNYSVLVTFDETNQTFTTNRTISMLNTNLDPRDRMQGHFIICSPHAFGTNVVLFGLGEYRATDIYLSIVPTNSFLNGIGTLYFAGLTNHEPTWSNLESNAVPVVVDNPTNGPAWPNDYPTVGNVSVTFSPDLNLWLMTYDGGRQKEKTTGVYFSYAKSPWGPWSIPQLIFNKNRDHGSGVFIHDPDSVPNDGLNGPVIGNNDPTNTAGGNFAPIMIGRFTKVTTNRLTVYYTLSTWNPYTVVKMKSDFAIGLRIDPGSPHYSSGGFSFSWAALPGDNFQVDYSSGMPPSWTTFTSIITSSNGAFTFTDDGTQSGGLGTARYYRVRTSP